MAKIFFRDEHGNETFFQFMSEIGQGAYGVVWKGCMEGYGAIAVKVQPVSERVIDELEIESRFVSRLPNYSVVLLYIVANSKLYYNFPKGCQVSFSDQVPIDNIYTIYDFIDGYTLHDMIKMGCRPSFHRHVQNLLLGLLELKSADIAHRDIKPANIMLDRGVLKFIDFGMSCFIPECKKKGGSPNFMPPEYFLDVPDPDYHKYDVFALGVVCLRMLDPTASFWEKLIPKKPVKMATIREFCSSTPPHEMERMFREYVESVVIDEFSGFVPLLVRMTNPIPSLRGNVQQCGDELQRAEM
jgi:serine/threonine protein kinase